MFRLSYIGQSGRGVSNLFGQISFVLGLMAEGKGLRYHRNGLDNTSRRPSTLLPSASKRL